MGTSYGPSLDNSESTSAFPWKRQNPQGWQGLSIASCFTDICAQKVTIPGLGRFRRLGNIKLDRSSRLTNAILV